MRSLRKAKCGTKPPRYAPDISQKVPRSATVRRQPPEECEMNLNEEDEGVSQVPDDMTGGTQKTEETEAALSDHESTAEITDEDDVVMDLVAPKQKVPSKLRQVTRNLQNYQHQNSKLRMPSGASQKSSLTDADMILTKSDSRFL